MYNNLILGNTKNQLWSDPGFTIADTSKQALHGQHAWTSNKNPDVPRH
jgi:hypothetical protein